MKYFHNMALEVAGCDMSPSMVKAALDTLTPLGLSADTVIKADIVDITSLSTHLEQGSYDAAIALGVLPHIIDEDLFFKNLKKLRKRELYNNIGGKYFDPSQQHSAIMWLLNLSNGDHDLIGGSTCANLDIDTAERLVDAGLIIPS
jgi:2-polyprenyl-3-methyl-5-hydroxy-6-metoxy-1,4-benzoquinol methylase